MDPTFFEINWERTIEVLTVIVILAFFIERALTLVFDTKLYENYFAPYHVKPLISFIVSFLVCWGWNFDALSIILVKGEMTVYGYGITAAIVAGGSKGALLLLRNIKMLRDESSSQDKPQEQ